MMTTMNGVDIRAAGGLCIMKSLPGRGTQPCMINNVYNLSAQYISYE